MKPEMQKRFLRFVTGSDRVPVGGMAEMSFKITRIRDRPDNLPEAHTCFNQLVLPDYPDKERLYQKLTIALSNAEGFVLYFSLYICTASISMWPELRRSNPFISIIMH